MVRPRYICTFVTSWIMVDCIIMFGEVLVLVVSQRPVTTDDMWNGQGVSKFDTSFQR